MATSDATTDVLVIGSGPTGTVAAQTLVQRGHSVTMLDYGCDDPDGRARVPDEPFSTIRESRKDQARFFLGDQMEGVPSAGVRVGAQLTPPRQFVQRSTDELLPIETESFHPMQSLALGGLGAAWGTACFAYSAAELERTGIGSSGFADRAAAVAELVGVSIDSTAGTPANKWWEDLPTQQPGLEIDDNASTLLHAYSQKASWAQQNGFSLGNVPLAVLSRAKGDRQPNPCFDMDFYGDSRRSAFRPRYLVEALQSQPRFSYEPGVLALHFSEDASGVTVEAKQQGKPARFRARRLLLCAGAINSARLALHSLPELGSSTTLLCNPYTYVPCVNWNVLGRHVRDQRHSFAQLGAYLQQDEDPQTHCCIQVYSYRSLLLFKLVKEMPLPPWAGLLVARGLVNALTIFGVFFPDTPGAARTMTLHRDRGGAGLPPLRIDYALDLAQQRTRHALERKLKRLLRKLRCFPIARVDPGAAGSIHYAGTIPFSNLVNPRFRTAADYRLADLKNVYVGDSSSWNWLPCKGPTFTAMVNAARIADRVAASL